MSFWWISHRSREIKFPAIFIFFEQRSEEEGEEKT
jgi:hypothetical protein